MNIGIYKPGRKIYFNLDNPDYTYGGSEEISNLAEIFSERGHNISLLSSVEDYNTHYHGSVELDRPQSKVEIMQAIQKLDYLFLFNGVFNENDISEKTFFKLRDTYKFKLVLLETDLLLSRDNHQFQQYDIILSQMQNNHKNSYYSHLEKLILYKHKIYKTDFNHRVKKGIFIGNERDRLKKFVEYIWRPNMDWKGKSLFFGIRDLATRQELKELLSNHLYSVVISGDEQNKVGFVSQRYYENALFGIINFVDFEYDKNELLISHKDDRRVTGYLDLMDSINHLTKEKFENLQQKQFDEITPWISGDKIYNHIIKILEKYKK